MSSDDPSLLGIVGLIVIPLGLIAFLVVGERVIGKVFRRRARRSVRPWLWMAPAILLMGVVLVYPTITTIYYSFLDEKSKKSVGFDNYVWTFTNDAMSTIIGNNLLWLFVFPVVTLGLALVTAVLTDRVKYEKAATTILMLPMAISFVAAGIIWNLMYSYAPEGHKQTGLLNAVLDIFGASPKAWIADEGINNFSLIFVAVWMNLGLATILISAGLKSIPGEWYEAARCDGASEWQVFRQITFPTLWPTLLMVGTTLVMFTLKVFDVVYVMTNGNFKTDVIANKMYSELFVAQNFGHASAMSVVLFLCAVPVLAVNIRNFRSEEATR